MRTTITKTRDYIANKLHQKYPRMECRFTEDFDGSEGGIWLCAEDGIEDRKGMPLFDYWTTDSRYYEIGVAYHLERWANRNGWYFEWYDCGTIMMWRI